MGKTLTVEIVQALSAQAVVVVAVSGTQPATIGMPRLVKQLASLRNQCDHGCRRSCTPDARTSATIRHIAFARRRYEVVFAMPRDGNLHQPDSAPTADESHRGTPDPADGRMCECLT
jgi:hypothetical protein